VALSAASRLVLEGFRGDSVLILGNLRLAQVASLILLLAGLQTFRHLWVRQPQPAR
jgi:prolipoprotein diacylglyceryltransferase